MKLYKSGSINTAKKRHNFRFTKSLGQNFLTDINIINAIIESSLIDEKSLVVEIGPGMGALTEGLTEVAGHVTAIEIDKNLIPVLEENFRDIKNFSLIQGDVLKVDIKKLIEDECEGLDFEPQSIRVVGNLPYYIYLLDPLSCDIFSELLDRVQTGFCPFCDFLAEVFESAHAKKVCKAADNWRKSLCEAIAKRLEHIAKRIFLDIAHGRFKPVQRI